MDPLPVDPGDIGPWPLGPHNPAGHTLEKARLAVDELLYPAGFGFELVQAPET